MNVTHELLHVKGEILVYNSPMESSPLRRKPGPRPKGFQRAHVFIPRDLLEWAIEQPEGLSGTIRRALEEFQKRRPAPPSPPASSSHP
jgi:hypothetical protein